MRGRILLVIMAAALAIAGCTRKQSLYIEPGKSDAPADQAARR